MQSGSVKGNHLIWGISMSQRKQPHFAICLEELVAPEHPYRKLEALIDFDDLSRPLRSLYSSKGRHGFGASFALRTLVLQFIEDLSDREMERFIQENLACRWFCDLDLGKKAPDHSFFGDFRKRLGSKHLMGLFSRVRESLKEQGLLAEIFTFVDASHLVSKLSTWDDRDKAIKKGLDGFNNKTASKVAADPQARMGCKGKNKYWYGYKEHASVDMQSGLINKIAATPANVTGAYG
jgi:transposase